VRRRRDGHKRISHRESVGRVESAPTGTRQIHLRPGMHIPTIALQVAFLVAIKLRGVIGVTSRPQPVPLAALSTPGKSL